MQRLAEVVVALLLVATVASPTVTAGFGEPPSFDEHAPGPDSLLGGGGGGGGISPEDLCRHADGEGGHQLKCDGPLIQEPIAYLARAAGNVTDFVIHDTVASNHTIPGLGAILETANGSSPIPLSESPLTLCSQDETVSVSDDTRGPAAKAQPGPSGDRPASANANGSTDKGRYICTSKRVDLRFVGPTWEDNSPETRPFVELVQEATDPVVEETDDRNPCVVDGRTATRAETPRGTLRVWIAADEESDDETECFGAGFEPPGSTGDGAESDRAAIGSLDAAAAANHLGKRLGSSNHVQAPPKAGFVAEGGDGALVPDPLGNTRARIAIAAVSGLAALSLAAVRLYRRLSRDDLLDNDMRSEMMRIVRDEPAIHASELARRLDVAVTTVLYHGRMLAEHDLIVTRRSGGEVVFLRPDAAGDAAEREMLCALKNPSKRRIIEALMSEPGSNMAEIARQVDRARNTVKHHVDDLIDRGLVVDESETRTKRLAVDEDLRSEIAERL